MSFLAVVFSFLCVVWFTSVSSVRVVDKKGYLILKGIGNWEEIATYYHYHDKDAQSELRAGSNAYDGGDVYVYPKSTTKATRIFLGGKPYEYVDQSDKDCAFKFHCVGSFIQCGPLKTTTFFENQLVDMVLDGKVGFAPKGKNIKPMIATAGLRILEKTWNEKYAFYVAGFDRTQSREKLDQSINNLKIEKIYVDVGADYKGKKQIVAYNYRGIVHYNYAARRMGPIEHQTLDFERWRSNENLRLSVPQFLNECRNQRIYVGPYAGSLLLLKSYDGSFGLTHSDVCQAKEKLDPSLYHIAYAHDEYVDNEDEYESYDAIEDELYDELNEELTRGMKKWKANAYTDGYNDGHDAFLRGKKQLRQRLDS